MTPTDHMNAMLLALSAEGSRMFRNNVAQGVVGDIQWMRGARPQSVTVRPGDAVVRHARVLHAGLFTGSHDLIGATPVLITPDMVGRTLGLFTSIEAKKGRGRTSTGQDNWTRMVQDVGGIVGVAYSAEAAVAVVRGFRGEA